MQMKKAKMNLPNRLTVMRLILVPFLLAVMLIPCELANPADGFNVKLTVLNILAGLIFGAASLTDMLDGKIARKYHLVTDFGKFLDPLADKFMVIAEYFGIICRNVGQNAIMFWAFMAMMIVTVFRELAVSSIRLITSQSANVVVAANMLGKTKTVCQIIAVLLAMIEPILHCIIGYFVPDFCLFGYYPLTYLALAVTLVFTVWSGLNYILSYWKYLDPQK